MSVPKFTAYLYYICLSIPQIYPQAVAVQIYGKFCTEISFSPLPFPLA